MTAPVLSHKKFYIVKPYGGYNYIKNPTFAKPVGVTYWTASNATIGVTGDHQRRGAYSMKVTPVSGQNSYVAYAGLAVTEGLAYTFSCDVKGVAGQAMRIYIGVGTATTFTATGYWQRVEVTAIIPAGVTTSYVVVQRDTVASTAPFYVDGVQFEQTVKATTFIEGNQPGCGWVGLPYHSTSWRDPQSAKGGLLIDLEDYCEIVSVTGLGHGDWNQILTKMTSGGDMYQTHIRKSRNFSIIVDFTGNSLSEIEANRKAVIDLIRPDLLTGQEMIVRYQGFAANGDEATNPVDIVCVPLSASMVDTPDIPSHQRAILNFTIPSGLLQGAYNDGAELDWVADFPAEFIVKRDKDGNWVKWTGSAYASLITGLNGAVYCMAEGPDGKIYVGGAFTNAGGVSAADYLARWNPVTEQWEAVIAGITKAGGARVNCMDFDSNGDLYIGGYFTAIGAVAVSDVAKITDLFGTPTANALGSGVGIDTSPGVTSLVVSSSTKAHPTPYVYIAGVISSVGGVANTTNIARWDGTSWSALSTGLNGQVSALASSPGGHLYIGGSFTNADGTYGDFLCYWDGTAFNRIGTVELTQSVKSLAFDKQGNLYVGGEFTNAGGNANADYIAKWTGSRWESLDTGTNNVVYGLFTSSDGKVYVSGAFTTAGGLSLTDRVAVWSNGAWQPLDIDLPGTADVLSILPTSDGSLYIGGAFSSTLASEKAECGIVSDRVYEIGVASASANTYPFMQVRGPGTLKAITNYSTGKSIMFDGLTLNAGEWINLHFDPLNLIFQGGWSGRGNLMRYVVPGSDYGDFYLMPGSNLLSLFMTGTDSNSGAFIWWTPLFWGIDGALL